jgi:hypothetical protein
MSKILTIILLSSLLSLNCGGNKTITKEEQYKIELNVNDDDAIVEGLPEGIKKEQLKKAIENELLETIKNMDIYNEESHKILKVEMSVSYISHKYKFPASVKYIVKTSVKILTGDNEIIDRSAIDMEDKNIIELSKNIANEYRYIIWKAIRNKRT